jgi:hypothetical protein
MRNMCEPLCAPRTHTDVPNPLSTFKVRECAESREFHTTIVLISCHYSPQALRQEKPHITEHTRRFWATPLTPFFITRVRKILTPRQELELIKNLIRSHKEKPPPPVWPGSLRAPRAWRWKKAPLIHTHALAWSFISHRGQIGARWFGDIAATQ